MEDLFLSISYIWDFYLWMAFKSSWTNREHLDGILLIQYLQKTFQRFIIERRPLEGLPIEFLLSSYVCKKAMEGLGSIEAS